MYIFSWMFTFPKIDQMLMSKCFVHEHKDLITRNMKTLALTVEKWWTMLTFLKSMSNSKVSVTGSGMLVLTEKSCQKKYACEKWKF